MAPAAAAAVSAAQTARAARKCELRHLAFSAASCARHSPRRQGSHFRSVAQAQSFPAG